MRSLSPWSTLLALASAMAVLSVKGEVAKENIKIRSTNRKKLIQASTPTKKKEDDLLSFWDCTLLDRTQKLKLMDHMKAVNDAQQYVDWDLLKDRYLIATFDGERRLRRRKRRRRRRKKASNIQTMQHGENAIASKEIGTKREIQPNNLSTLISNALENAGLGELKEQIKQAEIREESKGDDDESTTTDDSAGLDDDVAPVTNSPVPDGDDKVENDDILSPGGETTTDDTPATDDNAPSTDDKAPSTDDKAPSTDDTPATDDKAPSTDDTPATDDKAPSTDDTPATDDKETDTDDKAPATGDDSIEKTDDKPSSGEGGTTDTSSDDGILIPFYEYDSGKCPDDGDSAAKVPCAPDNLDQICDKYQDGSSFRLCWEACIPSFCCIHDAPPPTNTFAPSCSEDANCAQYASCYIVWWKLHDTIGPATQLQLEQNDDFFDLPAEDLQSDVTGLEFFREMLFHHFDDSAEIIRLGTVGTTFDSDLIFLNSTYWNTTI